MKPVRVTVNDKMQKGYVYLRSRPMGRDFRPGFRPQLTPKQMLKLGVFGGKYMTDCGREFPASWFKNAKLCAKRHEPSLNYFGVNASQLLSVWREKGWICYDDPRGWFQWYCRYYSGRRCQDDLRQIRRWRRHATSRCASAKELLAARSFLSPPTATGPVTLGL